MSTSQTVRLFGIADLSALLIVTCTLIAGPYMLGQAPPVILAGALYAFLWCNKAYFTSRVTGSAFPAVFGMGRHGEFNINTLWYVFSVLILCFLAVVAVYAIRTAPAEFAVAIASAIACGRATIPVLVMGRALAAVYDRQSGRGLER